MENIDSTTLNELEIPNERHPLEKALHTSQERLKLALEASDLAIWDWDMVQGDLYLSPELLRMLKYEPGDLENRIEALRAIVHPSDASMVFSALDEHLLNNTPYEVEHRMKTKTGEWRWMVVRGKVVERAPDGTPLRMVGVHRDIHETRMMQEQLRISEERHRIISNTISDYAYAYSVRENGTLKKEWSTQAFHEITGYSFQEMDDDGWAHLIHPDDMPQAMLRSERLMSGQTDVTEFRIITKSGEVRWLRDHGYPLVDEDTGHVVMIYGAAQDITQRKHDEERLHQQAQTLESRNEELDAFAYTVAHDLKNPIASMMGFASLIRKYYDRMDKEKILEHVDLIMESAYKSKEIINALLLLAGVGKLEQPQMTPLNMFAIVDDSQRRLATLIEESGAMIYLPADFPRAKGYAPWVEEVWVNYLSNALKYGGTPPQIKLGADVLENAMIRFWIQDNGNGLTAEEQTRVFTPFTRLNQAKIEGHGLGLSVVQRIVHKLGGEVGVESTVGQGSTFSFTLMGIE